MAREVAVRGGWQVKDDKRREVGHYALPTMSDTGEVDLRRFFQTVWRGKWVLLLTMAATMGATIYWIRETTPLYTADALIAIETRPSSIVRRQHRAGRSSHTGYKQRRREDQYRVGGLAIARLGRKSHPSSRTRQGS